MHMHADAEPNEKQRLQEATAIIAAGGVTNGILGVVKIVLGGVTGYLPLTASGVHSLSDIVSDVIAWVAVRMGAQSEQQGGDVRFHYGRVASSAVVIAGWQAFSFHPIFRPSR